MSIERYRAQLSPLGNHVRLRRCHGFCGADYSRLKSLVKRSCENNLMAVLKEYSIANKQYLSGYNELPYGYLESPKTTLAPFWASPRVAHELRPRQWLPNSFATPPRIQTTAGSCRRRGTDTRKEGSSRWSPIAEPRRNTGWPPVPMHRPPP